MIVVSKKFSLVLSAVALVALCVGTVSAQSSSKGFGTTRANEFRNNNSSNRFSSDTMKSRLNYQSVSRNRFAPRASRTPPSRSTAAQRAPKPFSSISRGPAVSPYLALSDPRSQASDFYNIIQPRREQRRMNQQQQRVNQQLQRENQANQHRLNQMAAVGPFDPRGSETVAPTGHAAVFQHMGNYLSYGGYFPPPSPGKKE